MDQCDRYYIAAVLQHPPTTKLFYILMFLHVVYTLIKGKLHPKLKIHSLSAHSNADGKSGEVL